MQKSDFKKLSDWLWEIPKSFRSDMRVPVRVYASEKMLKDIFRDRSLGQLVNVATLPGIVNYSMAMPDMHEGYGFCIGGVAAMDLKSGVISPGGVGYDINCLDGDAKILHSLGYYLPIKGFERKNSDVIKCVNFKEKKIEDTSILAFLKRKANPSVFEVVTKTGQKIKTTPDHPFYTPNGMIELKKLKEGDKIAIFPFEGVRYEKPSNKTIVSENDLKRTLLKLGRKPGDVRFDQNIRALEKRSLLSLTYSHPKLPYLLKIMGFILGDGAMNFIGKRKDGITYFVGKPEDLEEIREDIKKIGYTPSPIHYRKRKIKAEVREEYSFIVNAASLVIFLQSLGIPLGNKTHQAYRVPRWIFDCSLWQKRLFLAAFFGAELRIPHRRKGRRTMFNCPVLQMNKAERLIPSGRAFLDDISRLLKEFNVKTVYIAQRKRHVSTGGDVTWGLDLVFSSKIDSLINLWLKVGFEYNKKRQLVANIAGQYLRFKREILKEKRKAIETTIPRLLNTGLSYYNIAQQLATSNPLTKRFIIDVCWKLKKGRKKIIPQVSSAFPSFSQYSNEVTQGFNDIGMIWEEIVEIKKIPYKNWVYDFTVNHQDHNFIANNFVVSNCGMKLLKSDFSEKDIKPHLENLATEIQKEVPSGLGRGRQIKLDISSIDKILEEGAQRLVTQGYGEKEDLENCESGGRLPQADATLVSDHAKNRGRDQVGTLGSGNHFLEIQKVEEIFHENIA